MIKMVSVNRNVVTEVLLIIKKIITTQRKRGKFLVKSDSSTITIKLKKTCIIVNDYFSSAR